MKKDSKQTAQPLLTVLTRMDTSSRARTSEYSLSRKGDHLLVTRRQSESMPDNKKKVA